MDLKQCPFCGRPASHAEIIGMPAAFCPDEECPGFRYCGPEAWNRRAPSDPAREERIKTVVEAAKAVEKHDGPGADWFEIIGRLRAAVRAYRAGEEAKG